MEVDEDDVLLYVAKNIFSIEPAAEQQAENLDDLGVKRFV
jgi:hypothetical protein